MGLLLFAVGWVGGLALFAAATVQAYRRGVSGRQVVLPLDWAAGVLAGLGTLGLLMGPEGPDWYVRVLVPVGVLLVFPLVAFVHRFVFE